MNTITALVTRGFNQQFDYNVLEALKPFGADRHARLKRLEARLTSKTITTPFAIGCKRCFEQFLVLFVNRSTECKLFICFPDMVFGG